VSSDKQPTPEPLEEWRQRRLRVARFVQSKMLEVMKSGPPGAATADARAFDRAAEVERRIIEATPREPVADEAFRRWLK